MYTLSPVRKNDSLRRVLDIPRRCPDTEGQRLTELLTQHLRTPGGAQELRPLQALLLAEAADFGGALGMLAVGEGKTLVSYLLPNMFGLTGDDVVLLVPAQLREKTRLEFEEASAHWAGTVPHIVSYERLSTTPGCLERLAPQLVIADEGHKLKNPKASCTKRLRKYLTKNKSVKTVIMSGTLANRSFADWWHLAVWALPSGLIPLPHNYLDVQEWCEALDAKTPQRRALGALEAFGDTLDDARDGFGELLRNTPGVVVSKKSSVKASLVFKPLYIAVKQAKKHTNALGELWRTPSGHQFLEASEFWSHSVEISQGFIYEPIEEAPPQWLAARRECNAYVSERLRHSRKYESPAQIVEAFGSAPQIKKWLDIKNDFTPETVERWLFADIVDYAAAFEGLVWVSHRAMGEALDSMGLPYFSSYGKNSQGKHIYQHEGPAALSVSAMREGLNLQRWDRNLVLAPPASGRYWEQLIGRTHRSGQLADEVYFEVLQNTEVLCSNFKSAKKDAEYTTQTTKQQQKLNLITEI